MRPRSLSPVLALLLAGTACWGLPASQAPVSAKGRVQDRDWTAFLGGFPAADSGEGRSDMAILFWLQKVRTPVDVARAQEAVLVHPGLFSRVAAADLEGGAYPKTLALLNAASGELRELSRGLKSHFARPRPYILDPRITPAVKREESFSYPSGHSSWAMLMATLLARLQPVRGAAILDCGRQVGFDRALAGVHYPSDVEAGQRLGAAVAEQWLTDPVRARQLEEAREEWEKAAR